MKTGLVSVSFRGHTAQQIADAALAAGLKWIEWGSDVHAPCDDMRKLQDIVALQQKSGIRCSSYGTYFRLGVNDVAELPAYIRAAKLLGTDILRLWCGKQSPADFTEEQKIHLFDQCRKAAKLAEAERVTLCLECHMKTYTENKETALELMQAVNSPAFRMYWQPNQRRTVEENVAYARLLKDYITHIHVFQWKEKLRFPLAQGVQEWKTYLAEIPGEHMLLLEFMPDDRIESLKAEAKTLFELTGE